MGGSHPSQPAANLLTSPAGRAGSVEDGIQLGRDFCPGLRGSKPNAGQNSIGHKGRLAIFEAGKLFQRIIAESLSGLFGSDRRSGIAGIGR